MNKKFVKIIVKQFEDNREINKLINKIGFDNYCRRAKSTAWLGTPCVYLTKTGQLSRRGVDNESRFWLMCDYYGKKRTNRFPRNIDSIFAEFNNLWNENKTHIQELFLKKKYYLES